MKTVITLSALWLVSIPFFRLILFVIDRFSETSLPNDTYLIMAWAERLFVLISAALFLFLAFPGIIFAIGMGRAFSPSSGSPFSLILSLVMGLYALAALILNFPGFPLALHVRFFPFVQVLLFPIVALAFIFQGGFILIFLALLFSSSWLLCLRDRQTYTP